jgi:hypothetical protein
MWSVAAVFARREPLEIFSADRARARDGGPHLELLDDVLLDRLVPRFRF